MAFSGARMRCERCLHQLKEKSSCLASFGRRVSLTLSPHSVGRFLPLLWIPCYVGHWRAATERRSYERWCGSPRTLAMASMLLSGSAHL
uniref:Uncharacterized protein n=1 Tax=Arundo donax TaxID=35708 RepID=A0A0A9BJM8_ARUDO